MKWLNLKISGLWREYDIERWRQSVQNFFLLFLEWRRAMAWVTAGKMWKLGGFFVYSSF
jgi:hypothetical protein